MIQPQTTLKQLGLSEAEIDVYLAMLRGARTARDIVHTTRRSRPTVYYAISALENRGLLSKTGREDDQRYRLEPLERLTQMVQEKQAALTQIGIDVAKFADQFQTSLPGDKGPQIAFYEGVSAVQGAIMDSLYCHGRSIDSIVPNENFFWQLGSEFVERYVHTRHRLGIRTRNLWATAIDPTIIREYYGKSNIRIMPEAFGASFKTTIFLFDDQTLYVSSLASGYALVVRSNEHHELMKAFYELLWQTSRPIDSTKK